MGRETRRWIVGLGLGVALSGCPSRDEARSAVDAGVAVEVDAGIDAGTPDAGPQILATVVTANLADGGVVMLEARATIEPPASLTIRLPKRLKDFRIRLMDHQDKLVVSDDALSGDGLEYLVTPAEPLKTGRSYTVLLDAELGPVVTDELGGTFDDWELPFAIAGEIQPDPAPTKPGKTNPKSKTRKRR